MRIVITTRTGLRHQLFLSKACELLSGNIVAVFLQKDPQLHQGLLERCFRRQKQVLKRRVETVFPETLSCLRQEDLDAEIASRFPNIQKDHWRHTNAPVFEFSDINNSDALSLLRECNPDLILVFGGRILKHDWISLPAFGSLNMHYGILPHFRSGNSTEFALYRESYAHIGASIHYIDKGVDTGPIVSRCHVDPTRTSTLTALRAEVYVSGIEGLLQCARQVMERKGRLPATKETSKDSFFPSKCYSPFVHHVADLRTRLLRNGSWPFVPNTLERLGARSSWVQRYVTRTLCPWPRLRNGIYIFLYHSVVDTESPRNPYHWETTYRKVLTTKAQLATHVCFLADHATPVRLSEVPELLKQGPVEKPYFVLTFDDGYSNLLSNALPITEKYGVHPTVFINARFASQETVYYRVLLAILVEEGHAHTVRQALSDHYHMTLGDDTNPLSFSKDNYRYRTTEQAVLSAWQTVKGYRYPKVHLDWHELARLSGSGWEIGNHTLSHPTLSKLNLDDQKREIEGNASRIEDEGLKCINWLSYPNGAPKHVNQDTMKWMSQSPHWYGVFANGGVNRFYSRTEWLRIGVGQDSLPELRIKIRQADGLMDAIWRL